MAAPAAGGDKNRWASDCFRKGTEAVNKKNWDLAIEMFGIVLVLHHDTRLFGGTDAIVRATHAFDRLIADHAA